MADTFSIHNLGAQFYMMIEKFLNEYLEGFDASVLLFLGLSLYLMFQMVSMKREMKHGNQQLLSWMSEFDVFNFKLAYEIKEMKSENQQLTSGLCDMNTFHTKLADGFKEMKSGIQQWMSHMSELDDSNIKLADEIKNTNIKLADEIKEVKSVNKRLTSRLGDMEIFNTRITDKIDFLEISCNKLSDKISSLDMDNTVREKYRLDINDEKKKLVDYINTEVTKVVNYVNEVDQKIADSMKLLEGLFHQENQSLEKSIVSKLQDLEDRITVLEKGDHASTTQNNLGQFPMGYFGNEDTLPKVVNITGIPPSPPMLFPVTVQSKKTHAKSPELIEYNYEPVHMRDIKDFKEAIMTHGIHSTYVKQLLNQWSTRNRILPNDWIQLTTAVLDYSQSLQWKNWYREEAKILEQQGKIRGFFVSQDQILGEGMFADVKVQSAYNEHTLLLCRTAALNAWEKILDPGQKIEHYTKVKQDLKEPYTDFLQRLTTAVHRAVSDPEVRRQLILSLAFDNANIECKRMLLPLKIRSAPIEEWIQYAISAESLHCHEENWVGQAITNVKKRNQGITCFNCGKTGHIRRNCPQGAFRNTTQFRTDMKRRPLPSGLCRRCGKGRHWTNECRSTRDKEGNPLPSGNASRGFPREAPKNQTSKPKKVHSYPVIVEDQHSQDE